MCTAAAAAAVAYVVGVVAVPARWRPLALNPRNKYIPRTIFDIFLLPITKFLFAIYIS